MKKITLIALASAAPFVAFAQSGGSLSNVQTLITSIGNIIDALVPIMFTLIFVVFFYGVAMYVVKAGDEEAQKKAKSIMIYGVIGIAVVASIWGLVSFLQYAFLGGTSATQGNVPQIIP